VRDVNSASTKGERGVGEIAPLTAALSPTMLERVPSLVPFAGVDRRTIFLRATLLGATFLGLVASAPLWLNSRTFPLCRMVRWFPVLPSPWDQWFFGALLIALLLALWFYRTAIIFFLVASLFAFFEDQNRGQPWLYMYWVMLLLTLLTPPADKASCRIALSVAYIWSGIQKFSPTFAGVPGWFVAPVERWHLPSWVMEALRGAVATAPYVELGIGLALWIPALRYAAVVAALLVHGAALLFLGPLGHNYNWIVWPWNLAMMVLVLVLFAGPKPQIMKTLAEARRSKPALAVIVLYSLLPILSYFGWWDSGFSFTLYAENQAQANIFITQPFADRLPPTLRGYVRPFPEAFDPEHQGPLVFMFGTWCYEELHVPFLPEPRNFRSMFHFLRSYAKDTGEVRLIVAPRAGPVIFYEGDKYELLRRKD
jgi:hypothetical protein